MYINATFHFYVRRSQTPTPIRIRAQIRGVRLFELGTGITIDSEAWNAKREIVNTNYISTTGVRASAINGEIIHQREILGKIIENWAIVKDRIPTPEEFRQNWNAELGRKNIITTSHDNIITLFNQFFSENIKQNNWSANTVARWSTFRHKIPLLKCDNINDITTDKLINLYDLLICSERYKNSTIRLFIRELLQFLKWTKTKGINIKNEVLEWKPQIKTVKGSAEIIYLTKEELKSFTTVKLSEPNLQLARDAFLLSCYTGLRFSDVRNLKKSNINGNAIHIVTLKTSASLKIELNKHSKAIIDKYITKAEDYLFPRLLTFTQNLRLKKIGLLANIITPTRKIYYIGNQRHEEVLPKYKALSTHAGRRTFVVTALQLDIPAEVIMRWTGHSSFEAMKPYIAIVDELKAKSMQKFDLF